MLVAVFDIGAATVGAALLEVKDGTPPQILYSTRTEIECEKSGDFACFSLAADVTLRKVLDQVQTSGLGRPSRIFCNVFSMFYSYQTHVIRYRDPQGASFTVTKKFLDDLISRGIADQVKPGARLFERNTMRVRLNGYETTSPIGKVAKEIEVATYVSTAPDSAIARFEETIRDAFHIRHVTSHSFVFLMFSVLRDILSRDTGYLFVDIGGELSDVSIVHDGVLHETVSFPLGRRHMVRELSRELKTIPDEVISLMRLYRENALAPDVAARVGKVIERVYGAWRTAFAKAVDEISQSFILSPDIYVIGDRSIATLYAEHIAERSVDVFASMNIPTHVTVLDAAIFKPYVSFGSRANGDDLFLTAEAIYADKFIAHEGRNT